MSERRAKQRRREHPSEKEPELNMKWGPNRRQRRFRVVGREYTHKGFRGHIVNDYRDQRELPYASHLSNRTRMKMRRGES